MLIHAFENVIIYGEVLVDHTPSVEPSNRFPADV